MAKFSALTLECLRNASWTPDRKIDVSQYKVLLQSEGYPVHESVISFLEKYGALEVNHKHAKAEDLRKKGLNDDDHFSTDVADAIASFDKGWPDSYSVRVGAPLCVIGQAFRGYMLLTMDGKGRVFAGYDDCLSRIADSGEDAIEALCTGRKSTHIP